MKTQLQEILSTNSLLASAIQNSEDISDLMTLQTEGARIEFIQGIQAIEEVISHYKEPGDLERVKKDFAELCLRRNLTNQGTLFHFSARAENSCNRLYFDIAKALHPEASFMELFCILIPTVTKEFVVDLQLVSRPGRSKQSIPLCSRTELPSLTSILRELPVSLDTFNELIILTTEVFALTHIEKFNFNLHSELYRQLIDNHEMDLIQAIRAHNESISDYYCTLDRLKDSGLTLLEFLSHLLEKISISGKYRGATGQYASEEGNLAIARLLTYYETLPLDLQQQLSRCKNIDNRTFSSLLKMIEKQECIEIISNLLKGILVNGANHTLLNQRPLLSDAKRSELITRCSGESGKARICIQRGWVTTKTLSKQKTIELYKKINIESTSLWTIYVTSFPASEYTKLLTYAQVPTTDDFDFLGFPQEPSLTEILKILSPEQVNALMSSRLQIIEEKVKQVSPDKRLKYLLNIEEDSLKSIFFKTPSIISTLTSLLPEQDLIAFYQIVDKVIPIYQFLYKTFGHGIEKMSKSSLDLQIAKLKEYILMLPIMGRGYFFLDYKSAIKKEIISVISLMEIPDFTMVCLDTFSPEDCNAFVLRWLILGEKIKDTELVKRISTYLSTNINYSKEHFRAILQNNILFEKLFYSFSNQSQLREWIKNNDLLNLTLGNLARLQQLISVFPKNERLNLLMTWPNLMKNLTYSGYMSILSPIFLSSDISYTRDQLQFIVKDSSLLDAFLNLWQQSNECVQKIEQFCLFSLKFKEKKTIYTLLSQFTYERRLDVILHHKIYNAERYLDYFKHLGYEYLQYLHELCLLIPPSQHSLLFDAVQQDEIGSKKLKSIVYHDELLDKFLTLLSEKSDSERIDKLNQHVLSENLYFSEINICKNACKTIACYPEKNRMEAALNYKLFKGPDSHFSAHIRELLLLIPKSHHKDLFNGIFKYHGMRSMKPIIDRIDDIDKLLTVFEPIELIQHYQRQESKNKWYGPTVVLLIDKLTEQECEILNTLPVEQRLSSIMKKIIPVEFKYTTIYHESRSLHQTRLATFSAPIDLPDSTFSFIASQLKCLKKILELIPETSYFTVLQSIGKDNQRNLALTIGIEEFFRDIVTKLTLSDKTILLSDPTWFTKKLRQIVEESLPDYAPQLDCSHF